MSIMFNDLLPYLILPITEHIVNVCQNFTEITYCQQR